MKKNSVINLKGEKVNDITLNEAVWGITPNDGVIYDAVRVATAAHRQGSTRAPQWYHGGIVFGPHPRTYKLKMNKKERALALKSVLSYKNKDNEIIVLDNFDVKTNKTKDMINILNTIKAEKNILIVVNELTDNLILGTRNLPKVDLLEASEINVLDILAADCLVITEDAVKAIEEVLK